MTPISSTRRAISRLAIALLLGIGGQGTGLVGVLAPAAAQGTCAVAADKLALDAEEAELLRLVNVYRAANNVQPALLQSETLRRVATYLSVDNAGRRVSSLEDGLKRGLLTRFPDCGYSGFGVQVAFSEHVCCDDGSAVTPDSAFSFWKGSPIPNKNMLDPRFRYVGVSRECPVDGQCYWTLTLGTEPSGAIETVPFRGSHSAPAQVPRPAR